MNTPAKTQSPTIVPKRILKGKDGREPFADKIAKAKETLMKHPLPDFITKRQTDSELGVSDEK